MLPPVIDSRDYNEIVEQMKKIIPFYTPEWRCTPDDPDPGTALLLIFAAMFEQTVKRFNQVPYKNFIAFLNLLGVSRLPGQSARSYVTFILSEGAAEPVWIPAGTRISATADDGGEIVFETENNMLATPGQPVALFNVDPLQDIICQPAWNFQLSGQVTESQEIHLFDVSKYDNLQDHCCYLGHEALFNINSSAIIELELTNSLHKFKEANFSQILSANENVQWAYLTEGGWLPFDEVTARNNKLILKKSKSVPMIKKQLLDRDNFWISCRLKPAVVDQVAAIELDGIAVGVQYFDPGGRDGAPPDAVYCNDIPADLNGFYPFGKTFSLYDTFYLASREAFTKKGAMVNLKFKFQLMAHQVNDEALDINWKMIMKEIDFKKPEPPQINIATVSWEYWNGSGWVQLFSRQEYQTIFMTQDTREVAVSFQCPADLEAIPVNDQPNYWIRVRITNINNIYAPNGIYLAPWLDNIRLDYSFNSARPFIQHCLTTNNLDVADNSQMINGSGKTFQPFYNLDSTNPSIYLGFDPPPQKGPLRMFFHLEHRQYEAESAFLDWEYLSLANDSKKWLPLKVVDETRGFQHSGTVIFSGPPDLKPVKLLGRELYWIRVVNRDNRWEHERNRLPVLKGLFMNTVTVVQQESITEIMEPEGQAISSYTLARIPVAEEQVWVNEARWLPVDDFSASGAGDRHYIIDRAAGKLIFGDGKNGKVLPAPLEAQVLVRYKTGGGSRGNVGIGEINQLHSSIAFVDRVFNPVAAVSGSDIEVMSEAVERGPQLLRHRSRAVTAEDFEWLAREASQNIARVKCLPNFTGRGGRKSGWVTMVVMPRAREMPAILTPELKILVEKYLLRRAAANLALPGRIQVIGPVYLEISINAALVVDDLDAIAVTEKAALEKLNQFLQPLSGHFAGNGWEIGQYPHISVFYVLLKSISRVKYIEKASMSVMKLEDGRRVEVDPTRLADFPHCMVMNGKHQVQVSLD